MIEVFFFFLQAWISWKPLHVDGGSKLFVYAREKVWKERRRGVDRTSQDGFDSLKLHWGMRRAEDSGYGFMHTAWLGKVDLRGPLPFLASMSGGPAFGIFVLIRERDRVIRR